MRRVWPSPLGLPPWLLRHLTLGFGAYEVGQVLFEGGEGLGADLVRPAGSYFVEEGCAEGGHLVPAGGDAEELAAGVGRVRLAGDVPELLKGRDGFRGSLFRDAEAAAELRRGVGAGVDGGHRELVSGPYAGMPLLREAGHDLVDHRLEATE